MDKVRRRLLEWKPLFTFPFQFCPIFQLHLNRESPKTNFAYIFRGKNVQQNVSTAESKVCDSHTRYYRLLCSTLEEMLRESEPQNIICVIQTSLNKKKTRIAMKKYIYINNSVNFFELIIMKNVHVSTSRFNIMHNVFIRYGYCVTLCIREAARFVIIYIKC